jgi:hypothetical protein
VRVVDHEHPDLAATRDVPEHSLDAREQLRAARVGGRVGAEATNDLFEELGARERGVREERRRDTRSPSRDCLVRERALAGPGITGDEEEWFARSETLVEPA